ncbi:MAG TPA: tetratricopeptide repeat protein [Vicinamibacteria bacterium]
MKRFLAAGGLLVALALLGPEASAQTGTARGKVLDDKGQPLADSVINIEFQGGVTRKYETKTNKKGEFTQVGMQPGMYRFTVNHEGFQGTYIDYRISLGEPTYLPDVKLQTKAAAQAAAGGKAAEELGNAFKKATELAQSGQFDQAEAAFKEIAAKNPTIPEVYFNLGYIATQKKDWPAAQAAYEKTLELKPGYADAYAALARVYRESGQADKATEIMAKGAATGGDDAKMQFNIGIEHLNAGRSEEAMAAFQKAATLDPQNAEVHYHMGTLLVGQNKIPDAISHLEKYLSMSPTNQQNVATAQQLLAALKPKK